MASVEDLICLAVAALHGEKGSAEDICRRILDSSNYSERSKKRIKGILKHAEGKNGESLKEELGGAIECVEPKLGLADIALDETIRQRLDEFIKERQHIKSLRSYGLKASSKVLLSGPPGNGKTSLAGAIAKELNLPFWVVDYSNILDFLYGKTGSNIAKLFRTVEHFSCVVFVDEMETLLSKRSGLKNRQDIGETSRIVSTFLLEMDRLSDKVVFIGATNHSSMLDDAVARRFDVHWTLENPSQQIKEQWLATCSNRFPEIPVKSFQLQGNECSLSDVEKTVMEQCRAWAMTQITSTHH